MRYLTVDPILQKYRLKHGDEIYIVNQKADITHSKLKVICMLYYSRNISLQYCLWTTFALF